MGKVYRNMKDMPISSFAFLNQYDGSVYIKKVDADGKIHRKTIGALTVDTPGKERMVPNQYFRVIYQDLWSETYPDHKIPFHDLYLGMYALTLSVCEKIGLYKDIQDVYGTVFVNNILDYSMFSIIHRGDVTQIFKNIMETQVLFSDNIYSDSWYSDFFSKKITEDHHQFRIKWIQRLEANGLKKVWLAIDGSNNDCEARLSFLAKFGFPKSHNQNKTIVGYMNAVDAETEQPVTYIVYEGNVPDCQAFQRIATFLGSFDIEIDGIILDRGFAVEEVFKTIDEYQWKYVIMIPTDTNGHVEMKKEFSEQIRWKSMYMLEDEVLFGISGQKKLVSTHERISNICPYFDGSSGSYASIRLSKKILAEKRR